MGREIVYCEGCGNRLTEDDFDRGKADTHDGRPFCSKCRPVTPEPPPPPPPPRSPGRGTERRSATGGPRRKATERIPLAQPPPGPPAARRSRDRSYGVALGIGVGLG